MLSYQRGGDEERRRPVSRKNDWIQKSSVVMLATTQYSTLVPL